MTEKGEVLGLLRKLARQYGTNISYGGANAGGGALSPQNEREMMREYLTQAFTSLDPEFTVEFALGELQSGNDKSRKFCIWLIPLGSVYVDDRDMQEKHQRAIVRSGDSLLEAVSKLDDKDQANRQLMNGLTNVLKPKVKNQIGIGYLDVDEMTKINPELSQWIQQKYESCPDKSFFKSQLGRLVVAHHAMDLDLYQEHVRKLFDPETDSALRDSLLQNIAGFDVGEEQHATVWMLLLENQFPHPGDKKRHDWLESVFVELPSGFTTSNFASTRPVEFDLTMYHNANGIFANHIYGFGYGGGGYAGTGMQKSEGKPALVRQLLNSLWRVEPELSPEYKKNVLTEFLSNWMLVNDINNQFGQDKIKELKITEDMGLLVEMLKSGKKREEFVSNENLSPILRQQLGLNNPSGGIF